MYQAPHLTAENRHISTSSSVYSPIESEYGFENKYNNIPEDEREEAIEENIEEESMDEFDRRQSSHGSCETGSTQYVSYDDFQPIVQGESNQTLHSYMTANNEGDMSFSSINNSLLRNSQDDLDYNNDETLYPGSGEPDEDATPLVNMPSSFQDPIDDRTPIVGIDGNFGKLGSDNLLNPHGKTTLLPQQDLSRKFQRLSMTLQQSNMATSGDSFQFMNSFQQNIKKANRLSVSNRDSNDRTSSYYQKISEPTPQDEVDEVDEDHVFNGTQSEVSTISNRSSILGYENDYNNAASSADNSPRNSTYLDKPILSNSSSFNFNNVQSEDSSPTSSKSTSGKNSYSNIRGSRISPLKVVKKTSISTMDDDDVPVRKDLLQKIEQIPGDDSKKNVSEKEKVDMFIASMSLEDRNNVEEEQTNGLNIKYTDSSLDPRNKSYDDSDTTAEIDTSDENVNESIPESTVSDNQLDEENLSSLFIRALHPFDSSSLQLESDASICLSFEKDDLAFVHTIDDSGWGEVTMVDSLQRGWIPMNYFTIAVNDDNIDETRSTEDLEEDTGRIPNSVYLKPLFHSCGKFLINPLSHKNRRGRFTFSTRVVNSIRDGVRILLQETDCLSRTNEIVTKREIVRKTRKSLLADWYNLMLKANEFKGTSNFNKIEILTLMVYQVTKKAIAFLQVWSIESRQIIKRENERKLQNDMNSYPLLPSPPQAKQRITEINGLLYSYLGLIIGRLDLIEHNSVGCDILETVTHQVILLLRELLFISKTGSDFSSEKPADLDGSLDALLSLVSDLVSGVKSLIMKTLNESDEDQKNLINEKGVQSTPMKDYYYTQEGGDLIQIAARMIKSISKTISSIRRLLEVTGDFKLNSERSYPDYSKMKVEPEDFVKKCSIGIAKTQMIKGRGLNTLQPPKGKASHRYSMMRSGKLGDLSITPSGANILHDVLQADDSFSSNPEFEKFTTNNKEMTTERHNINDELLVDENGNLLGASFKGLVYTLTNEISPPEYFFVSTFFICFRSFANGIDLIEELITRFEMNHNTFRNNEKSDIGEEMRLKNRRKLIIKMFQLWLESYWNHEADSSLLTTLVNFFNEGISVYLPLDSLKLLEIAARLSSKPLTENQKRNRRPRMDKQLINRSITVTRSNRKLSSGFADNTLSSRYSMVDGYELSRINTKSSTSSLKSMSLSLPLGVGNQTSSSSSLLTKNQSITIEKVNLTFRAILGDSWCPAKYINTKTFIPLSLASILSKWYNVCDQSWVLSNYRPNLLDFNGLELAKQLTLIESHIFCSIKPDELLNQNFTAKRAHLKLAPNIRQSLLFTNCLSGYVLESILQPKINQKMRVNIIKTWLKVAISCLYLRNFNSLASIITSLQSHLITRLAKIWVDLSDKYKELYEYLSGIIHPQKNFNVYRTKLRNFLVSNEYNIPIVPYFSLFLQDLTFVTDGNPNYRKANSFLNQKVINIDKYLKTTRIIADIESLQTSYIDADTNMSNERRRSSLLPGIGASKTTDLDEYNIIPAPPLQELILLELWKVCQLNRKEEDRAWKLSCLIQPRDVS